MKHPSHSQTSQKTCRYASFHSYPHQTFPPSHAPLNVSMRCAERVAAGYCIPCVTEGGVPKPRSRNGVKEKLSSNHCLKLCRSMRISSDSGEEAAESQVESLGRWPHLCSSSGGNPVWLGLG